MMWPSLLLQRCQSHINHMFRPPRPRISRAARRREREIGTRQRATTGHKRPQRSARRTTQARESRSAHIPATIQNSRGHKFPGFPTTALTAQTGPQSPAQMGIGIPKHLTRWKGHGENIEPRRPRETRGSAHERAHTPARRAFGRSRAGWQVRMGQRLEANPLFWPYQHFERHGASKDSKTEARVQGITVDCKGIWDAPRD